MMNDNTRIVFPSFEQIATRFSDEDIEIYKEEGWSNRTFGTTYFDETILAPEEDLHNTHFAGCTFKNIDFTRMNLEDATFVHCSFYKCKRPIHMVCRCTAQVEY